MSRRVLVQHIRDIQQSNNARLLLTKEIEQSSGPLTRRCLECACTVVPAEAVIVKWRKSLSGRAMHSGELIALEAPLPKTRKALYVFLHECAHLILHRNSKKTKHRKEYEAEMFAHKAMQDAGIEVPEKMTANAKRYVAYKINQAVKRGARRIDADAYDFSGLVTADSPQKPAKSA